jgi:hypothetical protein
LKLDHDPGESAPAAHEGQIEEGEETEPALKRVNLTAPPFSPVRFPKPRVKRRRTQRIIAMILLIALIFALVRLIANLNPGDDQLLVRVGDQGTAIVDLRQSLPISPYLLGANVFPAFHTSSVDQAAGFMDYSSPITDGLRNAHIKLLRFPGGGWGEEHLLSYEQLNAFSVLLSKTGAEGMIQVRLSGSVGNGVNNLGSLLDRATQAGSWVDYMNNPHSNQRTGQYAHAPYHPIKFWTVGNEPNGLINPDTGKLFTVADYTNAFIQYSLIMHQIDPTIQVFGPETSQFYGVGIGPKDSNGQPWMDSFLKGVAAYEKAHPGLKFHLLDVVSFHSYPLTDTSKAPPILLSSSEEWNYSLPPLRHLIRQDLGRDAPIAVTEINSNPTTNMPTPGLSALWWADTLGTFLDQEVAYVAFFSAEGVDTPYPLFTSKGLQQTAMLRVMQVFSHLQNNLIPVAIQREPVSLYATQNDTQQAVSLLFVNKSPDIQLAQVIAQNQFPGGSPWHDLNISLSGYSITLVTLHRDGGAEAYSYNVPTNGNSEVGPLNYTVCGKASDVLAKDIPC